MNRCPQPVRQRQLPCVNVYVWMGVYVCVYAYAYTHLTHTSTCNCFPYGCLSFKYIYCRYQYIYVCIDKHQTFHNPICFQFFGLLGLVFHFKSVKNQLKCYQFFFCITIFCITKLSIIQSGNLYPAL